MKTINFHDSDESDRETYRFLDMLTNVFGEMVEEFDRIECYDHTDRYTIHFTDGATPDVGNAYGERLAEHGYTIVGFHHHHTDDDRTDSFTIMDIGDTSVKSVRFDEVSVEELNFTITGE